MCIVTTALLNEKKARLYMWNLKFHFEIFTFIDMNAVLFLFFFYSNIYRFFFFTCRIYMKFLIIRLYFTSHRSYSFVLLKRNVKNLRIRCEFIGSLCSEEGKGEGCRLHIENNILLVGRRSKSKRQKCSWKKKDFREQWKILFESL